MSEYALRLASAADTAARVRIGDLFGLTPAGPVKARTGIRPGATAADVAVSAGTMDVTVQPFACWVQGGVSVAQGGYLFVLDAAKTLTVANGHATLSRTDVVAVVVKDNAYDGSGATTASLTIVQGTAGAGVPAMPSNALPLRNITVPANLSAGSGGLTAGNLSTDRRTYVSGLGGVLNVASSTERNALTAYAGMVIYRTDNDTFERYNGTNWRRYANPAYQTVAGEQSATADANGVLTITFGTTFAAPPVVTANPSVSTSSLTFFVNVIASSITTTGCQVRLVQADGTPMTGARGVFWQATGQV